MCVLGINLNVLFVTFYLLSVPKGEPHSSHFTDDKPKLSEKLSLPGNDKNLKTSLLDY